MGKQKTLPVVRIELLITRLNQNHLSWLDSSGVLIWLRTFVWLLQSLFCDLWTEMKKTLWLEISEVSWLVLRHLMNELEWHAWWSDNSWPISVENLHTIDQCIELITGLHVHKVLLLWSRIWLLPSRRLLQGFVSKQGKTLKKIVKQ